MHIRQPEVPPRVAIGELFVIETQETQQRRALSLGASEFLTKPFSPKKLFARAAELAGVGADAADAE